MSAGPEFLKADTQPLFFCQDVTVNIQGKQLLETAHLSFAASTVTGLIGHNGSGKSTLLKVLAGQMTASGSILFQGQELHKVGRRTLARSIAFLPQDPPPTRGLLVRELVALGRYPWHGAFGRFGAKDTAKTQEAMELTDIAPLADRLVDTLSGGERQRAWIAMMVAQDAECLLLDEPISALDIAHQIEILNLLRDLSQTRGISVILVLHDINMAARYCDHLIALKNGRCTTAGPTADLLTSETLKDIFGVPMTVAQHPGGHGVLAYVD